MDKACFDKFTTCAEYLRSSLQISKQIYKIYKTVLIFITVNKPLQNLSK